MTDLLVEFLKFEKAENFFELKYKGIPYWQALRFDIYMMIEDKSISRERIDMFTMKKEWVVFKRAAGIFKNLFHDLKNWYQLETGDLLYMDRINERKVDGKIVDPYFDFWSFEEICTVRRCTLHGYSGKYPHAEVGTSMPDVFSAIGHIWNKIIYKLKKKSASDEMKKVREVCKRINKKFGEIISEDQLVEKVLENVKYHRVYGRYYERLLNKVQPRAIMVECAYDAMLWPLYTVAKKRHIPVIEIEHGRINDHPAYNYGDTRGVGKELPDYLFSYGEFWSQYINMPKTVKVIAVGNPFLESRKERFKDTFSDNKKVVFYSDSLTGKALEKIVLEFLRRNRGGGYKVYFKMHPHEMKTAWQKKYSALASHPSVEMVPGDKEIYELMTKARHHVTVASTVLYEALAFNTKRYVFNLNETVHLVQPLIDSGLAYTFKNVEEFENLLKNTSDDINVELNNLVWKSKAKDEGQKVLRNLMDKN